MDLDTVYRAARVVAMRVHAEQRDKGGNPYFDHVLRVEAQMAPDDLDGRILALVHDVWEDHPSVLLDGTLHKILPPHLVVSLAAITRGKGEGYDAYIERVVADPIARRVKLADLTDNMDLSRLNRKPTVADFQRLQRYIEATVTIMTVVSDVAYDRWKNAGGAALAEQQRAERAEMMERGPA